MGAEALQKKKKKTNKIGCAQAFSLLVHGPSADWVAGREANAREVNRTAEGARCPARKILDAREREAEKLA